MTHKDYPTMTEYCQKITENGQQLCVSWNGGHDSGYFEMSINEEIIDTPDDLQNAIIDLIADNTDYGSFAGSFDTEGEVYYNPATKCFEGNDRYTDTREEVKECSMEVRVPRDIWFDSIDIQLHADEMEIEELSAFMVIKDGARTRQHDVIEATLQKALIPQFTNEIESIKDISGAWDVITINYKDFSAEKSELVFYIKKFDYSFYFSTDSEIKIDLPN
ncbi:hypothetical protein [Chitinophaga cymbidii]|uniref:Uncharacterized protein n=1 Tax=Chitinophaga cymbidii TaxID=1096750 RepID=A0A512RPQ0_9BACT|nr:hypothetical protein [Chitinophaga cymbidii]GEP97672.1 hypothetical protein CCY01nite_39320 [Chitinophaga cymbidii]